MQPLQLQQPDRKYETALWVTLIKSFTILIDERWNIEKQQMHVSNEEMSKHPYMWINNTTPWNLIINAVSVFSALTPLSEVLYISISANIIKLF